jgi:peptidoglycan/xylan/chitin deacetylase (PgdA/CDA1 family)
MMLISLFLPSLSYGDTDCKCVAFTLDGVQDYFLTNVQMDIIKTFDQKGANLTIGIIGNDFGTDTNITTFIQNEIPIGDNKSIIEVANNGWKGEDYATLSKGEQLDLISRTQARINYLLKTQPLTFIAPYGNLNNDTISALDTAGLKYASGYWDSSDVPIQLNESNLYVVPPSISTGMLNTENDLYEAIPYDQLIQGIQQNITDNGVSVVSMQPLEFAQQNQTDYINLSNLDEIKNLGSLLDELKSMNITTVTITGLSHTVR